MRYAVERYIRYPLSQAAQAARVPAGRLRRAVVLGELEAEPVADERDYLIEGRHLQTYIQSLHPGEPVVFDTDGDLGWAILILLAIPVIMSLISAISITQSPPKDRAPSPQAIENARPIHPDRFLHGVDPGAFP